MRYARLENKTSKVKSLSREIDNTLLTREKIRTCDSLKIAEKLVNIHKMESFLNQKSYSDL